MFLIYESIHGVFKMPASRIPKQEWDRVKDAFNDLYYVRGLPLHKEGDGESVQSILQAEYNFTAR
jgi:hypothetical protein